MRAVIEVGEDHTIILKEVYSGVRLETREGNAIGVCMRDDTLEIKVMPKGSTEQNWWRVNMQTGIIEKMGGNLRVEVDGKPKWVRMHDTESGDG